MNIKWISQRVYASLPLTYKLVPDRQVGVLPVDEELKDIGMETQCGKLNDPTTLGVLRQKVRAKFDEALQRSQSAGAGRQQHRCTVVPLSK